MHHLRALIASWFFWATRRITAHFLFSSMNKVKVDTRKLDQILRTVDEKTLAVVATIGGDVVEEAKSLAPVDQGDLRDSIYMRTPTENQRPNVNAESGNFDLPAPKDKASVTVGPSVMHGIYQEFGTNKMAAQPFMAPAAANVQQRRGQYNKAFGRAVSDG